MPEKRKEKLDEIFYKLAEKTVKAVDMEKGNHISRKTERMITLCMTLANYF